MTIQQTYADDVVKSIVSNDRGLAAVSVDGKETSMLLTVGEKGGKKTTIRLSFEEASTFFNTMNVVANRLVRNMQLRRG